MYQVVRPKKQLIYGFNQVKLNITVWWFCFSSDLNWKLCHKQAMNRYTALLWIRHDSNEPGNMTVVFIVYT